MTSIDLVGEDCIRNFIEREGKTAKDVAHILQARFPNMRGFSIRDVQMYCNERGITSPAKTRINDNALDSVVKDAVAQVKYS